jgi:hypothetical protein
MPHFVQVFGKDTGKGSRFLRGPSLRTSRQALHFALLPSFARRSTLKDVRFFSIPHFEHFFEFSILYLLIKVCIIYAKANSDSSIAR